MSRSWCLNSPDEVKTDLATQEYIASDSIATVLFLAQKLGKPVLVEGPAGVGKTELGKAWAAAVCTQRLSGKEKSHRV